ncbi:MAG: type II CRISPR RNA-guided endonuclease Cas9, partial [Cellulosilyticaceae bacterium]
MSYILGLDIGIASVGWAVVDVDDQCEPYKINRLGVRIFDRAEQHKTGAALALPRREARGARRRNRRRRHRVERIKQLIENQGLLKRDEIEQLYNGKTLEDIYTIRYEALERKLTQEEFARLLIHLAKRRGFRSNRKKQSAKEDGKLLEAVKENEKMLQDKGYRTVGEMLYKDGLFAKHKRNTTDDYLCTVSRKMM